MSGSRSYFVVTAVALRRPGMRSVHALVFDAADTESILNAYERAVALVERRRRRGDATATLEIEAPLEVDGPWWHLPVATDRVRAAVNRRILAGWIEAAPMEAEDPTAFRHFEDGSLPPPPPMPARLR